VAPTPSKGRVAATFHEGTVGGATKSVLRAVPHLQEMGWEFVFYVDAPSDLYDWLRERGHHVEGRRRQVGFSRNWLRRPPGALAKLKDTPGWFAGLGGFLRRQRPDIFHANSLYTAPEALMARAMGVPTFFHVHEMLPDNRKARLARAGIRYGRLAPAAVSRSSAAALAGPGVEPRIVYESTTVPDEPTVRPDDPQPLVVGTVGWVCRRKGTDLFVEAARRVREQRPGVEFRLVGPYNPASHEWPWIQEVLAEAERVGVRHWDKAHVFEQMKGWDVMVLASRFDPFPLVVLEAMASGLPVVCTRVDGMAEQVQDGVTGLLAEPEDAADLAARILELIDDPARRRAMGAAGRERVVANFTDVHQARALDAAYTELLGSRPGGPRARAASSQASQAGVVSA
jgi:glycosyltransferase involved in cell wall biosynthesis